MSYISLPGPEFVFGSTCDHLVRAVNRSNLWHFAEPSTIQHLLLPWKLELIKYLGLILSSTVRTQRSVPLMQVEGPRHVTDRGPASDSLAWLYFPRHDFGIWKEWYSCTTCVSICNDILPAAGLLFQVFLKHYCLKFEPTYNNKLSRGKQAELRLSRGRPHSLLHSIFQSRFWTFRLCNVIIFYGSICFQQKKKIKKIGGLEIG